MCRNPKVSRLTWSSVDGLAFAQTSQARCARMANYGACLNASALWEIWADRGLVCRFIEQFSQPQANSRLPAKKGMGFLLAAISLLVLQAGQAVSAESISDLCLAGGAILQEQCSPLIALHIHGQTSTCCNTLKGLHDLGCFWCDFCSPNLAGLRSTKYSS